MGKELRGQSPRQGRPAAAAYAAPMRRRFRASENCREPIETPSVSEGLCEADGLAVTPGQEAAGVLQSAEGDQKTCLV